MAETDAQAADDFFPGYAAAFTKIGKERGWPPVTRRQFDALLQPRGALMVGNPETVAAKVKQMSDDLGGIDQIGFQMSVAALRHDRLLQATKLIGEKVAPFLRQ